MKALVVSDTHGDLETLKKVIEREKDANIIFHLGDGQEEVKEIKKLYINKTIIDVCGNCDIGSNRPCIVEYNLNGNKILATHGDLFKVKLGMTMLLDEAMKRNVDIVLYGHTHVPVICEFNKIKFMNPGALSYCYKTYGVINYDDDEIKLNIVEF